MRWTLVESPIDPLGIAVDDHGICRIQFAGLPATVTVSRDPALDALAAQLGEYFAGRLTDFDVPLLLVGALVILLGIPWSLAVARQGIAIGPRSD
jgi:O6-methylguanine-DNA--protein-cysteine methyltransferase